MEDDLFEVSSEIPYKLIQKIQVGTVSQKDNQYEIRIDYKLQDLPALQGEQIIRRQEADLVWLLDNLSAWEGRSICVPHIPLQGFIPAFLQKLYLQPDQTQIMNKNEKQYRQRAIKRCLVVLDSVSLPFINQWAKEAGRSIFVFLSSNYSLYRNPIYFKEEPPALGTRIKGYFLNKFTLFTGRPRHWDEVNKTCDELRSQAQKLGKSQVRLWEYMGNLYRLTGEFIQQRDTIRQQLALLNELYFRTSSFCSYLELITKQVDENSLRMEKSVDPSQAAEAMRIYGIYLQQQLKRLKDQAISLLQDTLVALCERDCRIPLAPK